MRKILVPIALLLLCALCVIGILFLGSEHNNDKLTDYNGEIRTLKETFQKRIVVGKQNYEVKKEFDGYICSSSETEMAEIKLGEYPTLSLEDAILLQGRTVNKGEVLINNVASPFKCKVDKVFVKNKMVFACLINYEDTFVEFLLPQEYLGVIGQNDTVSFRYNGSEYEGKVSYFSQFVTDGAVTIRLSYEDSVCRIFLNSHVSVGIVVEKLEDVIIVPENAVRFDSEGRTVVNVQTSDGDVDSVFVECGKVVENGIIIVVDASVGDNIP